jgi:hypothetical protein
MDKVLNLTGRLEDRKRKQQLASHRQRIETIQRIAQCSSCHLKCAMCGERLKGNEAPYSPNIPSREFVLCQGCNLEFQDFMEMTKGKEGSGIFWHNKEWRNLWSAWLDYQRAVKAFKKSTEFYQMTRSPDS